MDWYEKAVQAASRIDPAHTSPWKLASTYELLRDLGVVEDLLQNQTGLAIADVVKQLRPLRTSTITINGTTQGFPPEIPAAQRDIIARLGIQIAY
jgi:hypothetical protein